MKNRTKILITLLGLSFTLTACSSASNTARAQETAAVQTSTIQQAAPVTDTNPASNYIQVFIDPKTGELVTLDPNTGEAVPYTAPGAAAVQADSNATVSGSQTASASSKVQAAQTDQTAQTAQAADSSVGSGTQSKQTAAQSKQTGSTVQNQAAAPVDATTQATPAGTPANQANQNQNASQTSTSYIGEARALEIAMNHAGVSSANVQFSYAKLEFDDGKWIYDTEFYAGNTEYDYEINASTGAILSYDYDMESNYTPKQQSPATPAASAGTAAVSIETAKQTALARVSGATESHIRIYTDYDDGRMVYEGKIIYNAMEYEFEIDAATGNIIEWDAESIYD